MHSFCHRGVPDRAPGSGTRYTLVKQTMYLFLWQKEDLTRVNFLYEIY